MRLSIITRQIPLPGASPVTQETTMPDHDDALSQAGAIAVIALGDEEDDRDGLAHILTIEDAAEGYIGLQDILSDDDRPPDGPHDPADARPDGRVGARPAAAAREATGMTAREWLNVLAILNSIDEVPGLMSYEQVAFRHDPATFLRKADDRGQGLVWAEVERRLAGGA